MEPTPQTIQQIERAIRRIAENFPPESDAVLTDIHLQVKPSSGEILAYDDNDEELTRVVVEQWIEAKDDDFYEEAAAQLCQCIEQLRETIIDRMSVMHPFSFVLLDEDKETLRDLYLVDDDTVILSRGLLEGLDEELDQFLRDLLA
ncbi:MAG: hypothetical protein IJ197_04780 [Bacteroidaceae bacterium]|nr:hypothetical protein [Bacteroidaceae bacterium]